MFISKYVPKRVWGLSIQLPKIFIVILELYKFVQYSRRAFRRGKPSIYWWAAEIAELRTKCHRLRRLTQHLNDRVVARTIMAEYKLAKRKLRSIINTSKARCW